MTGQNECYTFYRVSSRLDGLKNFFWKGAHSNNDGLEGQGRGLFLWPSDVAANTFLQDLSYGNMYKKIKNNQALVLSFSVPKAEFHYPAWQFDNGNPSYVCRLLIKYADEVNRIAKKMYFPVNKVAYVRRDMDVLTGVSYRYLGEKKACKHPYWQRLLGLASKRKNGISAQPYQFTFYGKTQREYAVAERARISDDEIWCNQVNERYTPLFQALSDWMCCISWDYKSAYNASLAREIRYGASLRYTGNTPLQPSRIVQVNVAGPDKMTHHVLYDQKDGFNQACPFIRVMPFRERS